MTEVIAPVSGNEQQNPSPHAAGSQPHLWPTGELPLKYEAELLGKCGTPQSLISLQVYCMSSGLERLLMPTECAGIGGADLRAPRLVCTTLGCSGPRYALCYPF